MRLRDRIAFANPGALIVAGILIGTGIGCVVAYVMDLVSW